nr:immunoglobulin heavy chain junction region [Macaca mulatta]
CTRGGYPGSFYLDAFDFW